MRAPNRNFVVEYKSRSRQPKSVAPASIWGDTDLRAVALQVEEQAPHLFDAQNNESTPNDHILSELTLEVSRGVGDCPPGAAATEPSAEPIAAAETTVNTGVESFSREPVRAPGLPASKRRPARRSGMRKKNAARTGNRSVSDHFGMESGNGVSWAELDLLTAENSRLKTLMRNKLLSDHVWLRQMLARFP